MESGVDNDHIIEIALNGIENEELRDPKMCHVQRAVMNRDVYDCSKNLKKYLRVPLGHDL